MAQRISVDTSERLEQYSWEHHTSVRHAITELIWQAKVKDEQIRGQASLLRYHLLNKENRSSQLTTM